MRIAVIGLGVMGRNHKRVLEQLGHQVVTVDPAGHADLTDIEQVHADGAVLSVPAEQMRHYRGLDIPVLLIEKPGAVEWDELHHCWPHDTPIGYVERHNPAVLTLAESIDLVGELIHVEAKRLGLKGRGQLGPILDLATHDLDVLNLLGIPLKTLDLTEDRGHALGTFWCGHIEASHAHPRKIRTLQILGTEGLLQMDYQRQILDFVDTHGIHPVHVQYEEPLERMWRAILKGEPTAIVADGARVLRQLEGAMPAPAAPALAMAA